MLLIIILFSTIILLQFNTSTKESFNSPQNLKYFEYPPMPLNYTCELNYNMTNDTNYVSDKHMSVAMNCISNKKFKNRNYYNMNKPIMLRARAIGRPRQLRQIN